MCRDGSGRIRTAPVSVGASEERGVGTAARAGPSREVEKVSRAGGGCVWRLSLQDF